MKMQIDSKWQSVDFSSPCPDQLWDNPNCLASGQQGTVKLTAGYSTSPLSPYHTKTATVSKIQETIKQSAS